MGWLGCLHSHQGQEEEQDHVPGVQGVGLFRESWVQPELTIERPASRGSGILKADGCGVFGLDLGR